MRLQRLCVSLLCCSSPVRRVGRASCWIRSQTSAAELAAMIAQADSQVRTLDGRGNIAFRVSRDQRLRRLHAQCPKTRFAPRATGGAVGIDVGFFFLSRDRFVMYNSLQNTVIAGAPSPQALRSLIPVDLTYEQIFAVFTGLIPLPDHQTLLQYTVGRGSVPSAVRIDRRSELLLARPRGLLVRRFKCKTRKANCVLEGASSGTIDQDGLRIARRLSLTMPREGRRISVAFSHADLNADDLSFSYSVPSSARENRTVSSLRPRQ